MTVRTTRRILNGLAALCGLGVVAVGMWAMSEPTLPAPSEPKVRRSMRSDGSTSNTAADQSNLAAVWNRKLQGPLTEPRAIVKTTKPKPTSRRNKPRPVSAPRVELLATILDPSSRIAIFRDMRGLTDQKTIGQTLSLIPAGMRIESIESDHVKLNHRGRSFRIALKSDGPAPSFQSRRNNRDADMDEDEQDRIESGEAPDMSNEEPAFMRDPGVRRK